MLNRWNTAERSFETFLLMFIIFQPILDLLTSLCIVVLKINTTVGIMARLVVMGIGILYLLIKSREKENRKYLYYIVTLGIILGIGLVNNILIKKPILLGEEVKFVAKVMYPFVMISCYILAFKSLKAKENIYNKVRNNILYATLIINSVMVISVATKTDWNSYEYLKTGSRGWFYAGNELGAILALAMPIVLLYTIQQTTSMKKLYYWIPTLLMIFSLLAVGTKVGYGAIFASLATALVMCLIQLFLERKNEAKKKVLLLHSILTAIVFIGVIVITPLTPIAKNTGLHMQLIEQQAGSQAAKPEPPEKKKEEEQKRQQEEAAALIFSGRQKFLEMYKVYFKEAPLSQKLFGMGYGGNFKEQPKMVERDFHDMFFSFGIVGFLVIMLPAIIYGLRLLITIFKRFKEVFTLKYALIAASLALALGIAYTAGHVFTAPGVSIYFSVLLAYLVVDLGIE
ncbi:O-antigen ligase family protein [Microbacteriaceae bacterium 4G12]